MSVSHRKRLAFVIHDMNSWGGHDRSALEIAQRLSRHWPVTIYSYSLEKQDPAMWGKFTHNRIQPRIAHPLLARSMVFHGVTLGSFALESLRKRKHASLVVATGACSLVSDVVQVQFVHQAWRDVLASLPVEYGEVFAGAGALASMLKSAYLGLNRQYALATEKMVFTKSRRFIAISQSVKNDLKKYYGLDDQVRVIPHGVDADFFCPPVLTAERDAVRASLNISKDRVLLLLVGAYGRKGLGIAIEALAKLKSATRRRTHLLAVGDGNRAYFERLARDLGVDDRITFVDHASEVLPYYHAADVFVLPTFYDPFGMVILEAMSCGLPCLVSRCAGASELFIENESGLTLADPRDAEELALKLEPLIEDGDLRRRLGKAARRVAEKRTWNTVAAEYAAYLEPLVEAASEKKPYKKK